MNDSNKKILGQNITGGKGRIAYFLKAFGAKKKCMNKKCSQLVLLNIIGLCFNST